MWVFLIQISQGRGAFHTNCRIFDRFVSNSVRTNGLSVNEVEGRYCTFTDSGRPFPLDNDYRNVHFSDSLVQKIHLKLTQARVSVKSMHSFVLNSTVDLNIMLMKIKHIFFYVNSLRTLISVL